MRTVSFRECILYAFLLPLPQSTVWASCFCLLWLLHDAPSDLLSLLVPTSTKFLPGQTYLRTWNLWVVPSLKLTVRTWKWMVGILVSFWEGLFSGAMLVSGRVYHISTMVLLSLTLILGGLFRCQRKTNTGEEYPEKLLRVVDRVFVWLCRCLPGGM